MKPALPLDWKLTRTARVIVLVLLLVGIFILDTITRLEIAIAVFYVVVIMLSVMLLPRRGVIAITGASIVLTVLSMLLTEAGAYQAGIVNGGISISAIVTTAYLSLKMVAAQEAAYEARTQLARISRIQSLGELTASIAHEVNQPLAAIATSGNACIRWLEMNPPNVPKAVLSVRRIIDDANRAADVIIRVRGLASNEAPQKRPLQINEAIIEAISLARSTVDRADIGLGIELMENLPPVMADRVQIQQVLGNLILNAVEAITAQPDSRRGLEISSRLEDHKAVVVRIRDFGIGLNDTTLQHLFDAFWTTKEAGTGLGLTLCRSIVEAHGGRIWAMPAPEGGAIFQFSLPCIAETKT